MKGKQHKPYVLWPHGCLQYSALTHVEDFIDHAAITKKPSEGYKAAAQSRGSWRASSPHPGTVLRKLRIEFQFENRSLEDT